MHAVENMEAASSSQWVRFRQQPGPTLVATVSRNSTDVERYREPSQVKTIYTWLPARASFGTRFNREPERARAHEVPREEPSERRPVHHAR